VEGIAALRAVRLGAVVAIAVTAGLVSWFLFARGGSGDISPANRQGPAGPVAGKAQTVPVSAEGLRTLAAALKQPIYWAGPKPGYQLELTREADGRIFIRYLPVGVKLGSDRPLVTIGTYPVKNAFSVTEAVAARSDSVKMRLRGGIAFYNRQSPTSIYLAYPASDFQVEVYDPWAPGARRLVGSGAVAPVSGTAGLPSVPGEPIGLTLSGLKRLVRSVGHAVYWVGPKPGTTYEVTQATGGRTFVRYLPTGVAVGSGASFLTVGTYPVAKALDVVRGLAGAAGSVRVSVGGGAVAFYARTAPTNVYEAFPGIGYQVEVYDPSASEGLDLVASGLVVPVR
jgi:hypothetical protein